MKKITTFLFVFYICSAFAQQTIKSLPKRGCGTMEYLAEQIKNDPALAENMNRIERETQEWIKAKPSNRAASAVITIPVVFHVVYNTASQNIPDYRLLDQLRVLNEDYRKINFDASYVPAAWQTDAADCQVEFCLAQRDPAGNPTTGITRTSTTVTSFSQNNDVKYTSKGGKDIWDRSKYLNVWVCNLGGGVLGYAQFPGGAAATDGVVIQYLNTGVTGAESPYDKGRTLTHEAGHWLNLKHIWGDDSDLDGACGAGDACTGSDNVTDTPNQCDCHFGYYAPGTIDTDNCTTGGQGTMWMNYMDYTDDAAMYMFTNGQKARMQAVLTGAGFRASLASSAGCTPVANLDASITAINSPNSGSCNLTFSPEVVLTNKGASTLTSAAISYNIDGGANNNFSWTGSLAPGTSENVMLSSITSTAGIHTLNVSSGSPNGGADDLPANDSRSQKFTLRAPTTPVALPFTEGFQATTFPPANWTLVNPDGNNKWARSASAGGFGSSSASAKMDNISGIINIDSQTDDLISPQLDLSSANSTLSLTFNVAHVIYNDDYLDSLYVDISTDCGTAWTRVYSKGGATLATKAANQTTGFTPTAAQWRAENIDLGAYAGTSSAILRFRNESGSGNNIFIDDINISYIPAAPIADFAANNTTLCEGDSVTFTDLSTNTPDSWSWSITGPVTLSASIKNPTITFTTAGTYTVSLTAGNITGSDSEIKNSYITVNPTPAPPIVSNPAPYCLNASASALTASGSNLLWYASVTGGTGSASDPTPSTSSAGNYPYFVSQTVAGCESSRAQIDVTVNSNPTADFTYSGSGLDVTFTDASTGGVTGYNWDFGDGSPASSSASPAYTYAAPGTYTVTLTVSDGICSDTATQIITISATGIKEVSAGSILIYPNPGNGIITIDKASEDMIISIYNSIGKLIITDFVRCGIKQTIDLSENANGVYYLVGKYQGGVITKRISVIK